MSQEQLQALDRYRCSKCGMSFRVEPLRLARANKAEWTSCGDCRQPFWHGRSDNRAIVGVWPDPRNDTSYLETHQ